MGRRMEVRSGTETIALEIDADGVIRIDGALYRAAEIGPGEWQVAGEGGAHRLFVAGPAEAPWVWHDGAAYRLEVADSGRAARRRPREAGGDLSAPMPATVRAIHVRPGDAVTRGQVLVVLEAMKMELPLQAPADGSVAAVACQVGELVQPGVPLVVLA